MGDIYAPPPPPPKEMGDKIVSNQHIKIFLLALEGHLISFLGFARSLDMISCDKNYIFAEFNSSLVACSIQK